MAARRGTARSGAGRETARGGERGRGRAEGTARTRTAERRRRGAAGSGLAAALGASLAATACQPAPPSVDADPSSAAGGPEAEYTLRADQTHNRWSATIEPALRVPSGAVVEAFTKEASDGQLSPESTAASVAEVDFDPIHPLTGPLYVEGAEPGDVLAVTLHEIEVGDWGWAGIFPGFGFLADTFDQPWLHTFTFEEDEDGRPVARFAGGRATIPLAPFAGVMGVAPATDSMLVTIPPRANGGNMDDRHMVAGTTVYFPVQVEGALFSIGDTHAAQGDGEVSGTAIEAPMRIVYQVEVLRDFPPIEEPHYETADYYAVTAFGTDLDQAARKATRYMIDWLVATRGFTPEEAYVLASLAGDLEIAEVVDLPHVLVAMHMPKAVLTGEVGGGGGGAAGDEGAGDGARGEDGGASAADTGAGGRPDAPDR